MKSFILFLILSSSAVTGLKTQLTQVNFIELNSLAHILTVFLVIEVVSRLVRQGLKCFFSSNLNTFDLVISLLSLIYPATAIFRLLSILPGLNKITQMILKSLPSIANVSLLLAVHTYFYAIIGVEIFSKTDAEHFGTLALALISLFQVITLEGWADLMNFEMQSFPIAAPLYFISFVIVGTILILNVLVSVMTNAFVEAKIETEIDILKKSQEQNFDLIKGELRSISGDYRTKPKLELVVNKVKISANSRSN